MNVMERLTRRVQRMISIGGTTATPNDSGGTQTVQARFDGMTTRDSTRILFHFGFSACPPEGSDVVMLSVTGDPSRGIIIATNHQSFRPTGLKSGDTIVYDQIGHTIHLAQDGITIEGKAGPITINNATMVTINASDKVVINGNLEVNGTVTASGEGTFNGGHTVSAHKHPVDGSETATPTG